MNTTLAVLLLLSVSDIVIGGRDLKPWKFSQPTIEVFKPKGFQVSISYLPQNHIQMFSFHGNINEPITRTDPGQLSMESLRPSGNEWTVFDSHTELKPGDTIYYWIFILRNNKGYVFGPEEYQVQGPVDPHGTTPKPQDSESDFKLCERVLTKITESFLELQHELASSKETSLILRDLVGNHSDSSTLLTLTGPLPSNDDALHMVFDGVLKDKLGLHFNVKDVQKLDANSARFRVATIDDKITIIKAAKEKLKHSHFSIVY